MGYLRRTLQALPSGSVLDSAGYAGPGHNIGCEDEPKDPDVAPVHFQTIGDITVPGGTDPNTIISKVGDTWRSWGWYVFERDGFPKPNQFGYAPDGYRLQIEASNPPSYPPTLQGSTPCFPGDIATDDVDYPGRAHCRRLSPTVRCSIARRAGLMVDPRPKSILAEFQRN